VVTEHGGVFPGRSATLAELPGIGRSTAAAIAAFCFGERAAILDGNVKRVLTRVLGFDADLALAAEQQRLWALAEGLLPRRAVSGYTQGLMDLGATVCSLRRPACERCPLADRCVARAAGEPERYPVKSRRLKRGRRSNALLCLRRGAQIYLVQRPQTGVWAGLWSLPEFAATADLDVAVQAWPGQGEWLPTVQHALTHFEWTLHPLAWSLPPRAKAPAALPPGCWFSLPEALALGLPAPVRRLLSD
jgi:A/G-specific adenine glycosylase